jgi:hypothetical protein
MQTFKDIIKTPNTTESTNQIPTFKQMQEGVALSCVSEGISKKLSSAYESMCREMKTVHEDTTQRTCETYCQEAEAKLSEMMNELKKQCESYLAALH